MLARIKANRIGRIGVRSAAVLAGSQLTVAAAKIGDHAKLAGDCAKGSEFQLAVTLGHAAWSMLDGGMLGQMIHFAGCLLTSDSGYNMVHAVAHMIGHEVVAHLLSFVFQILS